MPKPIPPENIKKAREKIKELSLFTSVNCMPQISSLDLYERLMEIEQLLISEPIVAKYAVGDWVTISYRYFDNLRYSHSISDFHPNQSYVILKVRFNKGDPINPEISKPHFIYTLFGNNNLNNLTENEINDLGSLPHRFFIRNMMLH